MTERLRMRCRNVAYRQGEIEVMDRIHPGLVNLETWQIAVEADVTGALTDDDFVANTELELTPAEARALAAALLAAADGAEREVAEGSG